MRQALFFLLLRPTHSLIIPGISLRLSRRNDRGEKVGVSLSFRPRWVNAHRDGDTYDSCAWAVDPFFSLSGVSEFLLR